MTKIRIGFDARFALGVRRGIGNYCLDLLRAVATIPNEFEFTFYSDRKDQEGLLADFPNGTIKVVRPGFYPAWEQIALPVELRRDRMDLFHATGNTAPLWIPRSTKLAVTIHDVMFLKSLADLPRSPSLYQRLGRNYRRAISPIGGRRSDIVFTVSEFSRQDILASIPRLDPEKVQVTHLGLPSHFRDPIAATGSTHHPERDYILHLGALDPRKNSARVVRAFLALRREGTIKERLVVLGLCNLDSLGLTPQETQESRSWITLPGFVPDSEIPAYYRNSKVFLFPSLFEGFGLPLVEAMASGTPIITSTESSLPEIAGDAALLVDPRNSEAIKEAIKRLLLDPALRANLILKGYERAKAFAWDLMARQTLDGYRYALYGPTKDRT